MLLGTTFPEAAFTQLKRPPNRNVNPLSQHDKVTHHGQRNILKEFGKPPPPSALIVIYLFHILFEMDQIGLFCLFLFLSHYKYITNQIKAQMQFFGLEPGVAGWYAQTNPLSYGGIPYFICFLICQTELYGMRYSFSKTQQMRERGFYEVRKQIFSRFLKSPILPTISNCAKPNSNFLAEQINLFVKFTYCL